MDQTAARRGGVHRRRGAARSVVVAVVCGLIAGGITAIAQGMPPAWLSSLANSSGSWTLPAFLLALPAPTAVSGAACGSGALLSMLTGYVLTDLLRGYPASTGLMVFWSAAALIAGPLLGVGAQWLRRRAGTRAALGLSALCGVLIGEAGYGLLVISQSTSPVYWWGQGLIGVLLLAAGAGWKLRGVGALVQAVLFTAAAAMVFVVLSTHGPALMLLVP
ncbi:hypothetical protein E1202_28155 [Saccharopolyspora karakumensis]|uniref:Uncharacterized protein n=1 Tax=Saccharopolyspora karakumensis TaxID=2530386 RepID=A0A4R5BED0_9PSEU|nr:DUF6518 family protein [Saccharopolyspora karakumensis]TDD81952.1 hypothetical protein E1202_28155 [Saccharopolyspora karakumensis]